MRDIIFRGKRKDNGEWVCGDLIHYACDNGDVGIDNAFLVEDENDIETFDVIPETVGQYTGLTDKNGKKIFTNDIVAITALGNDYHQKGAKTIAVVEDYMGNTCLYINGKHQTGTTLYDIIIAHTVEVIGSATDNPELLEEG